MNDPTTEALRETQADLEEVASHLALIREAIEHGDSARGEDELTHRFAVSLVVTLGFERVAFVLPDEAGRLRTVAVYGQGERFGGPREPQPRWAVALAEEVIEERTLLRWGGEGVGQSRRRPREMDEDAIGLPLETGGEILGAVICTDVATRRWTLARHRGLELIGQSLAQVLALHRSRAALDRARRSLERELDETRREIEVRDERIDALSSSLDSADRVKETFLGLLSHELRTPIGAILGYASMLREGDAGPTTEAQDGLLARIEANGQRLGHLLDDLLFLTEAEGARLRPATEEVELVPLVDAVRAALPDPDDGPAPALEVRVEDGARRVRGDPSLVRRLLFHLLDEAWHAVPGGAVRLEARPEGDHVRLRIVTHEAPRASDRPASAPTSWRLGLGPGVIRLCASLLDGRSRLAGRNGARAEVWIPSASPAPRDRIAARPSTAARKRSRTRPARPAPRKRHGGGL